MLKPKFFPILEMCIDNGLRLGYRRAYKHSDNPDEETIYHKQYDAIMEEIYQWFDVEMKNDEHNVDDR